MHGVYSCYVGNSQGRTQGKCRGNDVTGGHAQGAETACTSTLEGEKRYFVI